MPKTYDITVKNVPDQYAARVTILLEQVIMLIPTNPGAVWIETDLPLDDEADVYEEDYK